MDKPSRKDQILQALARELETNPGSRITTAQLATVVGVSEAALYRHFPSKAKMFEALIAFAEESVFGLVNRIAGEDISSLSRIEKVTTVVLTFAERNPGISRILIGDALVGESHQLRTRVGQFFDRLETQFRQLIRDGQLANEINPQLSGQSAANLVLAVLEGRMAQYCRSGFTRSPAEGWKKQWSVLSQQTHWHLS